MDAPGFVPVEMYARLYGVNVMDVEVACDDLGIDTRIAGVPLNRDESIRQVLRQWANEEGTR